MILRPYKRIRELEESLSAVKELCEILEAEREKILHKEKKDMHNPTALCEGFKNLVRQSYGYPFICYGDITYGEYLERIENETI